MTERPQVEKPSGDVPFELGIEDIVTGDGDEATSGSKVTVHYVGAEVQEIVSCRQGATAYRVTREGEERLTARMLG